MPKKTIRDLTDAQLRGKRALVRVDFNVPIEDDRVTDDTRIRAALPTIETLIGRGACVVLLSHLGRPKGKPDVKYTLEPVANHLKTLLACPVSFVETTDSDEALRATHDAKAGSVLLLENTRFLGGEEKNDERLSRALAELGDLYVNDAFGSAHRAHASTEGVAHYLKPAVAGLLMERELKYLGDALQKPAKPFVAILGGAKISGKIDVIEALLPKGRQVAHRRRHGVHLLQGDGARDREVARRGGSCGDGEDAALARRRQARASRGCARRALARCERGGEGRAAR